MSRRLGTDQYIGGRPASGEAVTVTGLAKSFGATQVLRGVDLAVPAGGLVALLGPSGCGKTTLLRCVAGLERPDSGEVSVGDRVLSGPASFVAAERRRIGMVFQDAALFPHLSVARNVAYGLPRRAPGPPRPRRRGARAGGSVRLRGPYAGARCRAASCSAWRSPGRSPRAPR